MLTAIQETKLSYAEQIFSGFTLHVAFFSLMITSAANKQSHAEGTEFDSRSFQNLFEMEVSVPHDIRMLKCQLWQRKLSVNNCETAFLRMIRRGRRI